MSTPSARLAARVGRVAAVLAAALVVVVAAAGCYKRVVRAEGFGEEGVDTYEANVPGEPDAIDEALWGRKKQETWRDR